jgi:hypothetical protein
MFGVSEPQKRGCVALKSYFLDPRLQTAVCLFRETLSGLLIYHLLLPCYCELPQRPPVGDCSQSQDESHNNWG